MSLLFGTSRRFDSSSKMAGYPSQSNEEARVAASEQLKFFLATAPAQCSPAEQIVRFSLPNDESISCVWWRNIFYITGTDIVRTLVYRFQLFGRPVKNIKKFEEGVFSDLRNLKPGLDAVLEEPKSEFIDLLHRHQCVRTQKKQKVFFWFSVPHERLFLDALERDLKREHQGLEPTTEAVAEPALTLSRDKSQKLFDRLRLASTQRPCFSLRTRSSTSSLLSTASSYVSSEGGGGDDELSPVESPTEFSNITKPSSPTSEVSITNGSDCGYQETYSPAFWGIKYSPLAYDPQQPDEPINRSHPETDMDQVLAAMQQSNLIVGDHTEDNLTINDGYSLHNRNHRHHHQQQAKISRPVNYLQYPSHHLLNIPTVHTYDSYESPLRHADDSVNKVKISTSDVIETTAATSMTFASPNEYCDALSPDECQNSMSFVQTASTRSRSASLSIPSGTQPIEIHGRSQDLSSIHDTHLNRAYSADNLMLSQPSLPSSPLSGSPLTNPLHTNTSLTSSSDFSCPATEPSRLRTFQCPIGPCGRLFKRLEHLRRHMRTHTLERPYGCPACGRRFSRSDNLSQHRKIHKRNINKDDSVDTSLVTAQTESNFLESDSDLNVPGIEVSSSHNSAQGTQYAMDEKEEAKSFGSTLASTSTLSCSNLNSLVTPQKSHSLGYGQTCHRSHLHRHQHHTHPPSHHHHRQMNIQNITQSNPQVHLNNSFEGAEFGASSQLNLHPPIILSSLSQSRSFPSTNDLYNHRRAMSSSFLRLQKRYRLVDVPAIGTSRVLDEGSNGLGEESIGKGDLGIYCNELGMKWFGVKDEQVEQM